MTEGSDYATVVGLLRAESEAIDKAASRLQAGDIDRVIEILANCKGKIVLLGTGKSGIIAQKIAATMTSSGTAAINLHPSDAGHGGLGILTSDDVVLMLSNSGETDELLQLLPYLKRRKVPLVAIVGNVKSTLAQRADAILDASVDEEACPLNLAPTTSTTVALALGDALAMTLMQAKGLTAEDFASNHPAGQLGKRLTLRVADLMHSGAENPTIATDASWMDVVSAITQPRLSNILEKDPVDAVTRVPTDGIELRTAQVCLRENLLIDPQFVVTRTKVTCSNLPRPFDLVVGIQVLKEHRNPLASVKAYAQVFRLETRNMFASLAL